MSRPSLSLPVIGALCAVGASASFTVNDMAVKVLSDTYALHQVIFLRSAIGLVIHLAILVPFLGGYKLLRTAQLGKHLLRGGFIVTANMAFFLALSAMPIADATAIFFAAPMLIAVFSVIFLGEHVGPLRWAAIACGFAGTLIIIRPGTDAFTPVALLPLVAAAGYAGLHIMTRRMGIRESAVTMAFYIQLTFLVFSAAFGLIAGDGRFAPESGPVLDFLLRAWSMPQNTDLVFFLLAGFGTAFGGLMISQAYRLCEAALVAPLEYVAMPMAILWGIAIFQEWPDVISWIGMTLIVAAGLFMIYRETKKNAASN